MRRYCLIDVLYSKKQKAPYAKGAFYYVRRLDSNPRDALMIYEISRNRGGVTISPSASLIFEKSTDFSAFLSPTCQIFWRSDRKVIENEVWSSLIIYTNVSQKADQIELPSAIDILILCFLLFES